MSGATVHIRSKRTNVSITPRILATSQKLLIGIQENINIILNIQRLKLFPPFDHHFDHLGEENRAKPGFLFTLF
jgi:hypothetical protein